MNHYFITKNLLLANSLKRFFYYKHTLNLITIEIISEDFIYYKNICDKIDKIIVESGKDAIFYMDETVENSFIDNAKINILHNNSLIYQLCITFPELHWVFISANDFPKNYSGCNSSVINNYHVLNVLTKITNLENIHELFHYEYDSLFDPSGLRNMLKIKLFNDEVDRLNRNRIAFTLDDERVFSYLYAYAAFSKGYRVWSINSYFIMDRLLKNDKEEIEDYSIIFEDLFLNYPDTENYKLKESNDDKSKVGLSDLKIRNSNYGKIRDFRQRLIISVGNTLENLYKRAESNKLYINELKNAGKIIKMIYKPVPSLFGLISKLKNNPNYIWPIKMPNKNEDGHSAPGKSLKIAEYMIRRAEKIIIDKASLKNLITGAILAREAQEILDNRTPTVSLRALTIRQSLEVAFECSFHGIEYNLDVKNRLTELKKEVKSVCKWYKRGNVRKKAELNALTTIIGKMALIYREYHQFDEENIAISELRRLEGRSILFKYPVLYIFYPFRLYLEQLLKSIPFFIGAVLFWAGSFAFLWKMFEIVNPEKGSGYTFYFIKSLETMLSFSEGFEYIWLSKSLHQNGFLIFLLIGMPVIIGFVHLGIFITYLYDKFLRK